MHAHPHKHIISVEWQPLRQLTSGLRGQECVCVYVCRRAVILPTFKHTDLIADTSHMNKSCFRLSQLVACRLSCSIRDLEPVSCIMSVCRLTVTGKNVFGAVTPTFNFQSQSEHHTASGRLCTNFNCVQMEIIHAWLLPTPRMLFNCVYVCVCACCCPRPHVYQLLWRQMLLLINTSDSTHTHTQTHIQTHIIFCCYVTSHVDATWHYTKRHVVPQFNEHQGTK